MKEGPKIFPQEQLSTVIFSLNGNQTRIKCSINEKMRDIVNRFNKDLNMDMNNAQYLYGENQVNLELTFYQQASMIDKQRKEMNILVYINEGIVKSKDIICPKCNENCLISFENYKIKLYNCKNGHEMKNILFKYFNNSQIINENEIKCKNCNNTKYKSDNKKFYKCLNCSINLCPSCFKKHDKEHKIIDYNNINFICPYHNNFYVSYCTECKINLCEDCKTKHNNYHNIINYEDILPKEHKIKDELNEFKDKIDVLKETIKILKDILNNVSDSFQKLYEIFYDIVYNYNSGQKNYEVITNINSVKNFIELNEIDNIIKDTNSYKYKFEKIYDIFNMMNNAELEFQNMDVIIYYAGKKYSIEARNDELFSEVISKFVNEAFEFCKDGVKISESYPYYSLYELGIQEDTYFKAILKNTS